MRKRCLRHIDVYRDYELNIELNMNIRQFFLGMEEQESYPITASKGIEKRLPQSFPFCDSPRI